MLSKSSIQTLDRFLKLFAISVICLPLVPLLYLTIGNPALVWVAAYQNTMYADGYTSYAFKRVEAGDSASQVISLLGEPLIVLPAEADHLGRPQDWGHVENKRYERWEYAWYEVHRSFFIRGFLIDTEEDTVVAKISMPYWD